MTDPNTDAFETRMRERYQRAVTAYEEGFDADELDEIMDDEDLDELLPCDR